MTEPTLPTPVEPIPTPPAPTPDATEPTPIISPIIALLKSRKVIVSIAALVINFIVVALPDLAPLREELMTLVSGLALALIGTIAWEDVATKGREAEVEFRDVPTDEIIKDLFGDLVDTVITSSNGQQMIVLKPGVTVQDVRNLS